MRFPQTPVLISASSSEGGGLYSLIQGRIERIDRLTTMGMCVADGRLARLLKSPDPTESMTELLLYDGRGAERYYRLDGFGDPHDIAWTGSHFLIVSSIQNRVSWVRPDGSVDNVWQAPGETDSWHINCLCEHAGCWYLSVFGKFATHRGWSEDGAGSSGFVLRLDDNMEIISGLSQPHTPRAIDGKWVVCNSATHELLQIDPGSADIERRLKLEGYTRGIAVFDDILLVGESAGRYANDRQNATICVLDRASWQTLDRVEVETKEIYELLPVSDTLLNGVTTGFRTSRFRPNEQDQYYLFQQAGVEPARLWATGDPLPASACSISIEAIFPGTVDIDATVEVPVQLKNLGSAILVTAPPNPVYVCYRWMDTRDGRAVGEGQWLHTPLPRSIPPGDAVDITALVAAPDEPGDYVLRVTLLQEGIAWFDDIRATNASVHAVRVLARSTVAMHGPEGR